MILIVFGRAGQFLLLLLTMRLATTYLSPSEMGRLSLVTATTALFALFLANPVGVFINRRIHAWELLGRTRFYLKLHWLYLLAVCFFVAITLAVLNGLHQFDFQLSTGWLLLLVCGTLLFNTVNQTVIPSLNLLESRGPFVFLTLATILVSLISAVVLVQEFKATAEFWLLGLLTGQAVLAVIGANVFFGKLQPQLHCALPGHIHFRVLFDFAWPVAISVGLNWVHAQSYRFLVADTLGLVVLGLFVAGYGISAGLMSAFESVITTYFQPRFYKGISNNDQREQASAWGAYARAILPSLALVIFILIGLAPELTRLMLGPAYQSASQYVVWGVVAEGARVATGVYSMSAHARMRTRLLLFPSLLGALVCVGFVYVLPYRLGAHGVGVALALAGICSTVAMHLLLTRELKISLPYRAILKGALMGGSLFLITIYGRWLLSGAHDLLRAGVLIVTLGVLFLAMFYSLISPLIPRQDKEL